MDATDKASILRAVAEIEGKEGKLHILVNKLSSDLLSLPSHVCHGPTAPLTIGPK